MATITTTTILIEGKEVIGFQHLKLTQSMHTHHVLEVYFPMSVFEGEEPIENHGARSKRHLGSKISVRIENKVGNKEASDLEFSGIITELSVVRGENTDIGNSIVFTAQSNDIIANDAPNYRCYKDKTLGAIVKDAVGHYGFKTKIDPSFNEKLEYVVQHNESAYQFIQRLASQYGEWLYYNEDTLYFGKPGTEEEALDFNFDLIDYTLKYIPKANELSYFTNNYLEDKIETTNKKGSGTEGYPNRSAKGIFLNQDSNNIWVNANNTNSKKVLEAIGEAQNEANRLNQTQLNGLSTNANVAVGNRVLVENGKYRVIKITHTLSYAGGYNNRFQAIAGDPGCDGYPLTNLNAFPKSESQIAIVRDNHDPEGLGRLKVQFAWQNLIGQETPWIRVLVPHAGADQGFMFLPEVGDQVLVDFEGGNAECPYVVGSVYHKNQKPSGDWADGDNKVKALKTKGGHTILFKEIDGKESITIKDKEGNSIVIDTNKKDINITAGNNITLTAGADISITAGGNLKLDAGSNLESKAGQESKNESGMDYVVKAGTNAKLSGGVGIELKGTATAKLEAPMVDINGTAMTNVKGGIVNLN